jgi:hypothetical protein
VEGGGVGNGNAKDTAIKGKFTVKGVFDIFGLTKAVFFVFLNFQARGNLSLEECSMHLNGLIGRNDLVLGTLQQ